MVRGPVRDQKVTKVQSANQIKYSSLAFCIRYIASFVGSTNEVLLKDDPTLILCFEFVHLQFLYKQGLVLNFAQGLQNL